MTSRFRLERTPHAGSFLRSTRGRYDRANSYRPVRVHDGTALFDELGERLDELQAATGAPLTARRPWQEVWTECFTATRPFAVVVEDGRGELAAAAVLAERRRGRVRHLVPLGDGPSDQVCFPARDASAAAALAQGLAAALADAGLPWRLAARQLPAGDHVTEAMRAILPHAWMVPGDVSPYLAFGPVRETRRYVSRNHHQQVRRMRNRIERDGFTLGVDHLADPHAISTALPEVLEVCRARDHELRRRSQVDDRHGGPFLRKVVEAHARRGEVVLTTLRLNGRLAAYVLCFVDGDTYRMWNCRFHPDWSRYGVGRIANAAALEDAVAAGCLVFDWMRGEEQYKYSMANGQSRAVDLYAASNAALAATTTTLPRLRRSAQRLEDSGDWGRRTVGIARRIARLRGA